MADTHFAIIVLVYPQSTAVWVLGLVVMSGLQLTCCSHEHYSSVA